MSATFSAYQFFVELDAVSIAEFGEVSGLQAELEYDEWKEGGNNGFVHLLPARAKWSNITLKRGLADLSLWNWYSACVNGSVTRRGLSIAVYTWGASGSLRWNVAAAWPIKWSGPAFKAGSSELAFESIELAHQGWKLEAAAGSVQRGGR